MKHIPQDAFTTQADTFLMQVDVFPMQADTFLMQVDVFSMQVDAFTMQVDAFTMQADAFTIDFLHKSGKGERGKGKGFLLSPSLIKMSPFSQLLQKTLLQEL